MLVQKLKTHPGSTGPINIGCCQLTGPALWAGLAWLCPWAGGGDWNGELAHLPFSIQSSFPDRPEFPQYQWVILLRVIQASGSHRKFHHNWRAQLPALATSIIVFFRATAQAPTTIHAFDRKQRNIPIFPIEFWNAMHACTEHDRCEFFFFNEN